LVVPSCRLNVIAEDAQTVGQARRALKTPRLPNSLTEVAGPSLEDEVSGSVLRGDFSDEAREELSIEHSRIVQARFTAANCSRLRLTDVVVQNADFSGSELDESSFTRVEFRDCRMSGVILTRCSFRDVLFSGCRLDDANFRMSESDSMTFEGTDLRQSDFYGASLNGTRFFDCDLTGTQFTKLRAADVRFHGSDLTDLKGANGLAGAIIDSAQVYPVALGLLSELHVQIDDVREPQ
jgi:uncharacterized protein YjbI with pentapeptide repeats